MKGNRAITESTGGPAQFEPWASPTFSVTPAEVSVASASARDRLKFGSGCFHKFNDIFGDVVDFTESVGDTCRLPLNSSYKTSFGNHRLFRWLPWALTESVGDPVLS